jgi:hypothetical protein
MKKLTIILALAVAALATAGRLSHPNNPQTTQGMALSTTPGIWPLPVCPPDCAIPNPEPQQ